jgi:hypothetical protein
VSGLIVYTSNTRTAPSECDLISSLTGTEGKNPSERNQQQVGMHEPPGATILLLGTEKQPGVSEGVPVRGAINDISDAAHAALPAWLCARCQRNANNSACERLTEVGVLDPVC